MMLAAMVDRCPEKETHGACEQYLPMLAGFFCAWLKDHIT